MSNISTIIMPALSPTMTNGTIAKWHKKEGDKVESGDVLCEIVTDKSTVESESFDEGYLRKIVVGEGESALVNQGIAILSSNADDDISNYQLEEPNLNKSVLSSDSDDVLESKTVESPKTRKSSVDISSISFAPSPPKKGYKHPKGGIMGNLLASPLAKKMAKEKGLDLASVKGSGPHGRIIATDLEHAQTKGLISHSNGDVPQIEPGSYEEVDLTPIRKVIGERLKASKMSIPHYYTKDVVRADRMMDLRVQLKDMGIRVTYNDFVLKACAIALRKHPEINSGFNSVESRIIRFQTVDISLAVSIEDGLITPIINHADYKSLTQLSQEAKELAKRAKEGKLEPNEYQGGSFTVSNLGMYGIESFSAVINPPQAAILAVGGIMEVAISNKGTISSGYEMHLTLSADHRVIDGAEGAGFLHTVRRLLEHPAALVL